MTSPLISVVIPNWNRRDLLRACLQSLARQTLRDFEVIVVDNGSTDGSPEMILAEFAQTVIIRNAENRGFCAAVNQGIRQARGSYIALLNNDAEAEPRWLEELFAGITAEPGVGMCASKILSYEQRDVIDKVGHLIFPDGQNRGRGSGQIDRGQFDAREEALLPDGCAAFYAAQVFADAGLFDEDFFAYADDAEMGLRARLAGFRCLYIPGAVVYHHLGATLGRFSAERLLLVERNRMWLAAKLFPWRLLMLNPFYWLLRWGANAWAGLTGRGEAGRVPFFTLVRCAVSATFAALAGLPKMLGKRRQVRRVISDREFQDLLQRFRVPLSELVYRTTAVRPGGGAS